jgi:hypothetical protein
MRARSAPQRSLTIFSVTRSLRGTWFWGIMPGMTRTPIKPDYSARIRVSAPFYRAAAASLICSAQGRHLRDVLKERWPNDQATETLTRSATTPGSTTGWGAQVVGLGVADFLSTLGPASAGSILLSRCLQFQFDHVGPIIVHGVVHSASNAAFVAEGAPIPVLKLSSAPQLLLAPKKLAAITAFTRELFEHSTPNIEAITRQVLTESLACAFDTKLLDAVAADDVRPAGLRNGIAAKSESAAATPLEAMSEDIGTLIGAVATVTSNSPIILIAAPTQAERLRQWTRANFAYEILASSGLADGVVVAIASNALASACDPVPRFEISKEAVLHMDDTTPLDIVSAGVAGTVKSLWQTDSLGLRTVLQVSWGLRHVNGLAWVENVNW